MMLAYFLPVVIVGLIVDVHADSSTVHVLSSGYCSKKLIEQKFGGDASNYRPKVEFDPHNIRMEPKNPVVPGCFNLSAMVVLHEPESQITVEVGMQLAGNADPNVHPMDCRKKQPKCGCGEMDSCVYCDVCKDFKKVVKAGTVNNRQYSVQSMPDRCDCNIGAGTYTFTVKVCTPEEKQLANQVPPELINKLSEQQQTTLFSVVYVYNFRYNSLSSSTEQNPAAKKALNDRKRKGLIGCYVVAANVKI